MAFIVKDMPSAASLVAGWGVVNESTLALGIATDDGWGSYVNSTTSGSRLWVRFPASDGADMAQLVGKTIMGCELVVRAKGAAQVSTGIGKFKVHAGLDGGPYHTSMAQCFSVTANWKDYTQFFSNRPGAQKFGSGRDQLGAWPWGMSISDGLGLEKVQFVIENCSAVSVSVTYVALRIHYRDEVTLDDVLSSDKNIPFQWAEIEGIQVVPTTHSLVPEAGDWKNDWSVGRNYFGPERIPLVGTLEQNSRFRSGRINPAAGGTEDIPTARLVLHDTTQMELSGTPIHVKIGHGDNSETTNCMAHWMMNQANSQPTESVDNPDKADNKFQLVDQGDVDTTTKDQYSPPTADPWGRGPFATTKYLWTQQDTANTNLQEFTFATWIRVQNTTQQDNGKVFTKHGGAGPYSYELAFHSSSSKMRFSVNHGGLGGDHHVYHNTNMPVGWHHLVTTYKDGILKLYINGALDGTTNDDYQVGGSIDYSSTDRPLYVGRDRVTASQWSNIVINDMAMYSDEKDAAWVATWYEKSKDLRKFTSNITYTTNCKDQGWYSWLFSYADRTGYGRTRLTANARTTSTTGGTTVLQTASTSGFATGNTANSYVYVGRQTLYYNANTSTNLTVGTNTGMFSSGRFDRHFKDPSTGVYPEAASHPTSWVGRWVKVWTSAIDHDTGLPFPQQLAVARSYLITSVTSRSTSSGVKFFVNLGPFDKILDRDIATDSGADVVGINLSGVRQSELSFGLWEGWDVDKSGSTVIFNGITAKNYANIYEVADEINKQFQSENFALTNDGGKISTVLDSASGGGDTSVVITDITNITFNSVLTFCKAIDGVGTVASETVYVRQENANLPGTGSNTVHLATELYAEYPDLSKVIGAGRTVGSWGCHVQRDRIVFTTRYGGPCKLTNFSPIMAAICGFKEGKDVWPDGRAEDNDWHRRERPRSYSFTPKSPGALGYVAPNSDTCLLGTNKNLPSSVSYTGLDGFQADAIVSITNGEERILFGSTSWDSGTPAEITLVPNPSTEVLRLSGEKPAPVAASGKNPLRADVAFQWVGPLDPLVLGLTCSLGNITTPAGTNNPNNAGAIGYDIDKFDDDDLSMFIDGDHINGLSFENLRRQMFASRIYVLTGAINVLELIKEEMKWPSGLIFTQDSQGRLAILPQATFGESDLKNIIQINDDDVIMESAVSVKQNTSQLVNHIEASIDHDPFEDEFRTTIAAKEPNSIKIYGEKKRDIRHKGIKSYSIPNRDISASSVFDPFVMQSTRAFNRYGFEAPTISLKVGPKGMQFRPGNIVLLNNLSDVHNPYAISSSNYSGGAGSIFEIQSVTKNDSSGVVSLEMTGDYQLRRTSNYAPSLYVASWNGSTNTATITINTFSDNDLALFSVNDILVTAYSDNGAKTAGTFTITAIDSANNKVTINAAPAGIATGDELTYAPYGAQAAQQKLNIYVHSSNSANSIASGVAGFVLTV